MGRTQDARQGNALSHLRPILQTTHTHPPKRRLHHPSPGHPNNSLLQEPSPSFRSYLCRPVGDNVSADPVNVELTADLRDLDAEVVGHVRLLQQRPRLHDAVGQRLLLGVVLGPEVWGRWKARGDTSGGE